MVCLGNICRSPLAEGIMQHLVKQNGLDWEVDPAGTGNWHVGEGPDKRSTRTAREQGIDISRQVCRLFTPADFDDFDHILVMDKSNLSNVLAMARNADDRIIGPPDLEPLIADVEIAFFEMLESSLGIELGVAGQMCLAVFADDIAHNSATVQNSPKKETTP